jgi:hypothetical protein
MKVAVFWGVMTCSLVDRYQHYSFTMRMEAAGFSETLETFHQTAMLSHPGRLIFMLTAVRTSNLYGGT